MIKVLLFYDVEGWAWWHRCQNIKHHLSTIIAVDILRFGDEFDHTVYDFVVIFEAMFWQEISHVPESKVIVGCSCPKLIDSDLVPLLREKQPVAVVVNNADMTEAVSRHHRCFYCPNGVDEELFFPAKRSPSRGCAAWVGSTRSFVDKGLSLLRQACSEADMPFVAVDQADNIGHQRLYTQAELRDRIYHQATVYLCASEAEGTPNPCLEALACGIPVITTPVGNMPELIVDGDNGILVHDRASPAIAEAIRRIRGLDSVRMSASARSSILKNWTWHHQVIRYARMFEQLKAEQIT